MTRHPVGGPLVVGVLGGMVAPVTLVGGALPGYIVGRAGVGLWLTVGAFVGGIAVLITTAPGTPAPDVLFILLAAVPIYLVPFAFGYWWGRGRRLRAIEGGPAAS